jgi:hypothetical protein
VSDEELETFLEQLYINVNALEFDVQYAEILSKIQEEFSCTEIDAEFFYNNALNEVKKLSTQETIEDRTITKKDFIDKINNKDELFNQWYLLFNEQMEFFRVMKKEHFSQLNMSPYARFILIDCKYGIDDIQIQEILIHIATELSKVSSRRDVSSFCPYVYLHHVNEEQLIRVKHLLRSSDIKFLDGHNFKGAEFDLNTLLKKPDC